MIKFQVCNCSEEVEFVLRPTESPDRGTVISKTNCKILIFLDDDLAFELLPNSMADFSIEKLSGVKKSLRCYIVREQKMLNGSLVTAIIMTVAPSKGTDDGKITVEKTNIFAI